jgi:Flp pilus assembly protein TadG
MLKSEQRCRRGMTTMKTIRHRRKFSTRRRGAALVEFAMILPVFLTLMLGIFEMGKAIEVTNLMSSAVREGGRLAAMEWEEVLPANTTANQKVIGDIKNFLAASGIPSSAVTVSITSAEGNDEGQTFDLNAPANKLRLFRITASVPFSAVSTFPANFMNERTIAASLVFRTGGSLTNSN